jgi:replicative DNA helicase
MPNAVDMVQDNPLFQKDLRPMPYWAMLAEDKLTAWASGKAEGYSTGFPSLDAHFRLVGGEMAVIAARPSQGKTILGVQLAENVARQLQADGDTGSVAIFSAEMTGWSLVVRMAGAMSGVNTHSLRMGKGQPGDIGRLRSALSDIKRLPIWIDDGSAPTTKTMLEQLTELNETNPIRMMLFDFMELGGDRAQSEDLRVGAIAVGLKDIAKKLKIPVIALSQLNRGVEDRANKMPGLSDLRYSGQIEQVADVVAFIMRPEYYAERGMKIEVEDKADLKGVGYISIAKNRHGPVANVKLAFVKQLSKFAELERVNL